MLLLFLLPQRLYYLLGSYWQLGKPDTGAKLLKNELVRYFNNNSGGDVNVNEVALVDYVGCRGSAIDKVFMSRDKLASTVTVPNTGQLKVTYTVQLTYPA